MSIVRALDVNGDWTFGRGQNNYLRNRAALSQRIQTRLLSFLGDCFFDIAAGIDWFNLLGGKDQIALNLAISATLLNTEEVTSILELSITLDHSRRITIEYSVNTVYGMITNVLTETLVTNNVLTEDGDALITESGDHIVL